MDNKVGLIISSMDQACCVYIGHQFSRDSLSSSFVNFSLDIHTKRFTACVVIGLCD